MKSKSNQDFTSKRLALLNGMVEGSRNYILALDNDYNIVAHNSSFINEFEKVFNKKVEIGLSLIEILSHLPEVKEKLVLYLERALKGERFTIVERSVDEKSFHSFYEISFNSIKDQNGNMIGISLIISDISEKMREEEKILHLSRLYSLLSQINQLILKIKDRKKLFEELTRTAVIFGQFKMAWIGIIDEINKNIKVTAYHGYSNGYIERLNLTFSKENKTEPDLFLSSLKKGKYFISNDIETDKTSNSLLNEVLDKSYKSYASFPLKVYNETIGVFSFYSDEKGFFNQDEIELILKLIQEISFALEFLENEKNKLIAEEELHKLNEELEKRVIERTAQLEAANKELEAFAYTVSHDLRSPLRHITGFISLLSKRLAGKLDEQNKLYINSITQASKRMGMLIDDLLAFSKMSKSEMSFSKFNIDEIVKTVISEFKPEYENRKINWEIDEFPVIEGDPSMFKLVFTNLIGNAIKFTRTKETAQISIKKHDQTKNNLVICVKDNGVGFDMHQIDRIFGVFQRLHDDEEFEGTGIGLAIVKRVIDRHGGNIWAEGVVNEGAAFFISFPFK